MGGLDEGKNELKLKERYADGSAVHYLWEATASGSIAGSEVQPEEGGGGGEVAVRIRNLSAVLRDYDGDVAALRLVSENDTFCIKNEEFCI